MRDVPAKDRLDLRDAREIEVFRVLVADVSQLRPDGIAHPVNDVAEVTAHLCEDLLGAVDIVRARGLGVVPMTDVAVNLYERLVIVEARFSGGL